MKIQGNTERKLDLKKNGEDDFREILRSISIFMISFSFSDSKRRSARGDSEERVDGHIRTAGYVYKDNRIQIG